MYEHLRSRAIRRQVHRVFLVGALIVGIAGCGGGRAAAADGAPRPANPTLARDLRNISFDPTPLYRQMGLIAQGLPFPVVGRVGFVGGASADTTHVIAAFSFAVTTLSFAREADNRFRANYTVGITLDRGGERVRVIDATETLVVGTYRETSRVDESVLFQEILDVAPGRYTMTVAIRDVGSQRSAQAVADITVPAFSPGTVSSPIPINEVIPRRRRDVLPEVLLSPRATVTFGRDSLIPLYLESYGENAGALQLLVRNESGSLVWTQPVEIEQRDGLAAGVVEVPVGRLGIGVAQLSFARAEGGDTASAYVYVGFGEEMPVARFEDMLAFLRYFATASRLQKLRETSAAERPAAWTAFLAETDSTPNTPDHEDLRNYFTRLIRANARFREEGVPGWMSDRGKVLIVLGEPTQVYEPTATDFSRGRQQLWDYRELGLQLVFYDQSGTGRWRLTQTSEVRFDSEFRRRLR